MATTPSSMQGMVAVSDPDIPVLGYLTWFSVPDQSVGLRRLKQMLAVHGLPPSLAPRDTKGINVFKRAMREQEGRKRSDAEGAAVVETTVTQVIETSEDCVYQISRVMRDYDERVVDFPRAMRVIYNKRTEEIRFNPLGGVPKLEVLPMMETITDYYEKNSSKVTGARVRGIVRNYLKNEPDEQRDIDGLSGENLRGKAGGIYFIPAHHFEQVKALSDMLNELYRGGAYLHAVPMADGASEREIIRRHHIANTRQEMKEAIGEAKDLLRADRERAPRTDVVANKWAQLRAIQRRAATYNRLLQDEQDEISDLAGVLHKQLSKLTGG